jgi:hypothetical protein
MEGKTELPVTDDARGMDPIRRHDGSRRKTGAAQCRRRENASCIED